MRRPHDGARTRPDPCPIDASRPEPVTRLAALGRLSADAVRTRWVEAHAVSMQPAAPHPDPYRSAFDPDVDDLADDGLGPPMWSAAHLPPPPPPAPPEPTAARHRR